MDITCSRLPKTALSLFLSLTLVIGLSPVYAYGDTDEKSNEYSVESSTDQTEQEEQIAVLSDAENTTVQQNSEDSGQESTTVEGNDDSEPDTDAEVETTEAEITTPSTSTQTQVVTNPISGTAHIQDQGWMCQSSASSGGILLGTTGKSKRLEALILNLNSSISGSVDYSVHVQDTGWMSQVSNGTIAGTIGESRRAEAVKISLSGDAASQYDIYYRVHVQDYGWLGWAVNGELAGTVGLSKRAEAIEILMLPKGETPSDYDTSVSASVVALISWSGHSQDIGWNTGALSSQSSTFTIGTTGMSKRLEAIKLSIGEEVSGSISYSVHVQDIGWTSTVSDGTTAGTTGKSKRIEAVKITLSDDLAQYYDIYYRAHVANIGWMNWAKNGEAAGTEGWSISLEAIQITLVEKGSSAPSGTGVAYLNSTSLPTTITYSALSGSSWIDSSLQGTAGTTGQSLAVTGIKASISSSSISGGISYSAHVADVGWLSYVSDGTVSSSGSKNVQAIRFKLTGDLAQYYDIYYRAHVANYGWMGWAKNGAYAGTTGLNRNLEAYQIVIVPKGAAAPGSTSKSFSDQNGFLGTYAKYISKAQSYSSGTEYLILVDLGNHMVVVFTGSKNDWSLLYAWSCTTGASGTETITGTYRTTGYKRASLSTDSRAITCTQIVGGYFFHSILSSESELGKSLSHGCIRLSYSAARWIYDNIDAGTTVVIYN